jgi:hypothetical protein
LVPLLTPLLTPLLLQLLLLLLTPLLVPLLVPLLLPLARMRNEQSSHPGPSLAASDTRTSMSNLPTSTHCDSHARNTPSNASVRHCSCS